MHGPLNVKITHAYYQNAMDSILFPFKLPSRNLLRICEENQERTHGNVLSPDQYMSSVPINSCRKVLRKSMVICSYMPLLEI